MTNTTNTAVNVEALPGAGNALPQLDADVFLTHSPVKPALSLHHAVQIDALAGSGVDMVTAQMLTYAEEAIGVVKAAQAAGLAVAIGLTIEIDGCLPSGQTLRNAIEQIDVETGNGPAYYIINCTHAAQFEDSLDERGAWSERVRAVQPKASRTSQGNPLPQTPINWQCL